jgi:hypothetical protein
MLMTFLLLQLIGVAVADAAAIAASIAAADVAAAAQCESLLCSCGITSSLTLCLMSTAMIQ